MENEPLLQFFELPIERSTTEQEAYVRSQYRAMAHRLVIDLPRNPERTVAIRKLMESQDSALRALVMK